MFMKEKTVWLLVILIAVFILISWFSNLRNTWEQEDKFIFLIKKTFSEINNSFKSISNELKSSKSLTEEELQQLKQKILEHEK